MQFCLALLSKMLHLFTNFLSPGKSYRTKRGCSTLIGYSPLASDPPWCRFSINFSFLPNF